MTWTDRCFLAAASRLLVRPLAVLHHHAETLRRWHRRRAHRRSMLAVDFFTVETIWLQRLCVLFFIELGSRPVHVAGSTPNPDILLEIGSMDELAEYVAKMAVGLAASPYPL
jgi:hypothetical protein